MKLKKTKLKKSGYRIKAIDAQHDIYCIQKKVCFIWWTCPSYGVGSWKKNLKTISTLVCVGCQEKNDFKGIYKET